MKSTPPPSCSRSDPAAALLVAVAISFAAAAPASAQVDEFDGWIEIGAGSFTLETTHSTLGNVEADGTGVHVEAGLRMGIPDTGRTGFWVSLSHLSVDYDNIEIQGRTYAFDTSGDATLLSLGIEGVPNQEVRWNPYIGFFLGTDSNRGIQGGLRYRFENNIELGGKILVGSGSSDVSEFSDPDWAAAGVSLGYAF